MQVNYVVFARENIPNQNEEVIFILREFNNALNLHHTYQAQILPQGDSILG